MNDRNSPTRRKDVVTTARVRGAKRRLCAAAAALAIALPLAPGAAQSPQQLSKDIVAARVDSMVRAHMAEKGPASISIAISRGNETLVEKAWGMADIAANRPASATTIYNIASVGKQFTASLLLKQVERGKLALTDSIGHYLTTGLRPEWRPLTIEQLLNHTAGLQGDFEREGPSEEAVAVETMIGWAARDSMAFPPGTRFAYSNVGYLLLGALVEKLYSKPYGVALREEITGPLGLRALGWCSDPGTNPMMAASYHYHGPGRNEPSPNAHPSKLGGGAICSSAADLAAWNRALHGGRVLSAASYADMTTPRGLAAPRYGFGLTRTTAPWGAPVIYHTGAVLGFSAENAWFPAEALSVTVLYNSRGNGFPTPFLLDIARAISVQASAPSGDVAGRQR